MTATARVCFGSQRSYNVMEAPMNWVWPWLIQQSTAAVLKVAGTRRASMHGAAAFDRGMHDSLNKSRTSMERHDLLMVHSGAMWTASKPFKAGYLPWPCCPWCGSESETLEHLWWECHSFEQERRKVTQLLKGLPWNCLPPALARTAYPRPPQPASRVHCGDLRIACKSHQMS